MPVEKIANEIIQVLKSGVMLPGGIKSQFSICGKIGCKCADPDNPIKHGPYNKLSFSVSGKSSTMFIKQNDLMEAQKMVARFHLLKGLCNKLGLEYVDLFRAKRFCPENLPILNQIPLRLINTNTKTVTQMSRDSWKKKSLTKQNIIKGYRIKVHDLTKSRIKWKEKAMAAKNEIEDLKRQLSAVNNELDTLKKNDFRVSYSDF